MAYDLLPNNLIQQTADASTEQAKKLLSDATGMAGGYLQSIKQMAGGSPDQPMRTMAKEQMDINNALTKANEYMAVSGKVPELDFLNKVGLQGTLGPVAGQDTLDTQNANADLAVKWYNASKSGRSSGSSGSSGGSGGTVKQTQTDRYNNATGDAYGAVNSAIASGVPYEKLRTNIINQAGELKSQGVDYNAVITYLDSVYPSDNTTGNAGKTKDLDSRPWWKKGIDTVLPGAQFR